MIREFSCRSASSRYSGTRPTSTRQIWATTCSSWIGTVIVSGRPSSPVHERRRLHGRDRSRPSTPAASPTVDALAEVALVVHQPDGDHRHRAVRRRLEDVAGERAEAAGVDRQRAGARRTRPRSRRSGGSGSSSPSSIGAAVPAPPAAPLRRPRCAPGTPRRKLRDRARRTAPPAAAGPGCAPHSSQRCGSSSAKTRVAVRKPAPGEVVRDPRERQRAARAVGRERSCGVVKVLGSGVTRRYVSAFASTNVIGRRATPRRL